MKRSKLLVLSLSTLLIVSCNNSSSSIDSLTSKEESFSSLNSSIESSVSSEDKTSSSISSSSEKPSSSSLSSSSSASSSKPSSSSSISSSSEEQVIDLGTKTIKEVREYCSNYVTDLNSSSIGVNEKYKVTIQGLAISKFNLVKTAKAYGLNVSAPGKVMFGDDTGYIACASTPGSEGNCLYGKVANYAGQATSKYTVTGYLSIYLGQPELYVPDTSYTFDSSLNVSFDSYKNAAELKSINELYTKTESLNYNCAGHGYEGLYSFKSLKCVQKDYDGSVYTLSDGNNVIKVIPNKSNSLSVGSTYDISGLLTTKDWAPALRLFDYKVSSSNKNVDIKTLAKPLSISSLKAIKASQDDTSNRFDIYTKAFKDVYYVDAYVSYYTVNGKYYLTLSDEEYKGSLEITNENTAHTTYNMIAIENHDCWNISGSELERYCSLYNWLNTGETVRIYYSLWQTTYTNKKPKWKVNIFEELLPVVEE